MEADRRHRSRPFLRAAIFSAAALLLAVGGAWLWQTLQAARLRAATERLRTMYFTADKEGARAQGPGLLRQFPNSTELEAWYILATHWPALGDRNDSLERARRMTREHPKDPWSWFALAGVEVSSPYSEEQPDAPPAASAKALAMMPHHPDFIWMRAFCLLLSMDHAGEIPDFIDAHLKYVPNPSDLLILKAQALQFLGTQIRADQGQIAAAYAILEEVRRRDPGNRKATSLAGMYLSRSGEPEKGLPLLKHAAAMAPESVYDHREYWRAFNNLDPALQPAERAAVLADVEKMEARSGERPWGLSQIAEQYGALGMRERQVALEDRLLREQKEGPVGRIVLSNRVNRLAEAIDLWGLKPGPRNPDALGPVHTMGLEAESLDALLKRELTDTLKQSLWDYVSRHDEKDDWLLPRAYATLFTAIRDDPTVGEEDLLRVVRGLVKYPRWSTDHEAASGALVLADRGIGLVEAEAITRERMSALEKALAKEKSDFKNEVNYRQLANETTGEMHDTLGWILLRQQRTAEAEKELALAHQLAPGQLNNLYHLGKLAELQGDPTRARRLYAEGSVLPSRGENPCARALKELYEDSHGSLRGFEADLAIQKDRGKNALRDRLLAERLEPPVRLSPFLLKDLAGVEFSSARLEGKVAVIDFWGVWCPGCRTAAPYFQKLVKEYEEDPHVVIFSIDAYDAPPLVQKWLRRNELTFPVLMDDGYVTDHVDLIEAFPTTWFVNRSGEIVYVQHGSDENLVEEFSWRIEELKRR